jgi:hypothetical protein
VGAMSNILHKRCRRRARPAHPAQTRSVEVCGSNLTRRVVSVRPPQSGNS